MDSLLDTGRTLYADNFYSSVPLVQDLLERTLYCGTLRTNRKGLPKTIVTRKMKSYEVIGMCNKQGIKVIKWQHKRSVLMITSKGNHNTALYNTGRKNRKQVDILKLLCVIDYNKAKKGVDYSDQMPAYYTALRKTLKWYKKVAFELIFGAALVNSWIIYNTINSNTKWPLIKFREEVAFQLANKSTDQTLVQSSKRKHILTKPEGSGTKKRRNCMECYKKLRETMKSKEADKRVTKVTTYCSTCKEKPALCLPCFNFKHNAYI
ncbi:uncharacterized protein [Diabrotica undecimpunctata]|uniref:uncharacterized protein n=1 Tax=Diabrotica undecimpunctata TaxID=50387 RepID=UPI003B63E161